MNSNPIYNKIKYSVPQYAKGGPVNPDRINAFPGLSNLINPFEKPSNKKPVVKLVDDRKIRATTNEKINPNVDLVGGDYDKELITKIVGLSKKHGVDPYTAIAVALQETKLGKSDDNVGHLIGKQDIKFQSHDSVENFVELLKHKTGEYSDKLGIDKNDKILRLQAYNGLGTIKRDTEKDYHGFEMQKIYGVPIPEEGISMKKNPLYGKQIDEFDKLIRKNKDIQHIVKNEKAWGKIDEPASSFHKDGNKDVFTESMVDFRKGEVSNNTDVFMNHNQIPIPDWDIFSESWENTIKRNKPIGDNFSKENTLDSNSFKTTLAKKQYGGDGVAKIDSILNANKNLEWVRRLFEKNTPSIQIPGENGLSTHFMESGDGRVYPTVVKQPDGTLKYLGDDAYNYADSTKTYIKFPTDLEAQQFAKNYKQGTGVLKKQYGGSNNNTDMKSSNSKNKIYDRIAYALPKHQFGGPMLEYFKNLIPKINSYQGQSSGVNAQSNLYSGDAQKYYKNLIDRNNYLADPKYDKDKAFETLDSPFFDKNFSYDAYKNYATNAIQTGAVGPGTAIGTPSNQWYNQQYNHSDPNYNSQLNVDINGNTVPKNPDGTSGFNNRSNPRYDKNNLISGQIQETGLNMFSLMQGQEAYDNKVKENLITRNTGHQGFRYGKFGGAVNTTGYTPGTDTYNNPFNIIPGGNITMKNTPFPVLAKPDNGVPKILFPGQNHIFPNANYVTETPYAQYGGNPGKELLEIANGPNQFKDALAKIARGETPIMDLRNPLQGVGFAPQVVTPIRQIPSNPQSQTNPFRPVNQQAAPVAPVAAPAAVAPVYNDIDSKVNAVSQQPVVVAPVIKPIVTVDDVNKAEADYKKLAKEHGHNDDRTQTALKEANRKFNTLSKSQQDALVSGVPEWTGTIADFEDRQGSAEGKHLPNYGIKIDKWKGKYPYLAVDEKGNPKTKISREDAMRFIADEYLPKVKDYPEEVQKRVVDYMYNSGRNPDQLLMFASGIIDINEINDTTPELIAIKDKYGKDSSQYKTAIQNHSTKLKNLWEQNKNKVQGELSNPEFVDKLNQARDHVAWTTNNPERLSSNPTYEKTWYDRVRMFDPIKASYKENQKISDMKYNDVDRPMSKAKDRYNKDETTMSTKGVINNPFINTPAPVIETKSNVPQIQTNALSSTPQNINNSAPQNVHSPIPVVSNTVTNNPVNNPNSPENNPNGGDYDAQGRWNPNPTNKPDGTTYRNKNGDIYIENSAGQIIKYYPNPNGSKGTYRPIMEDEKKTYKASRKNQSSDWTIETPDEIRNNEKYKEIYKQNYGYHQKSIDGESVLLARLKYAEKQIKSNPKDVALRAEHDSLRDLYREKVNTRENKLKEAQNKKNEVKEIEYEYITSKEGNQFRRKKGTTQWFKIENKKQYGGFVNGNSSNLSTFAHGNPFR